MHRWFCVPMIGLLLLTGCSRARKQADIRTAYREMEGCTMEAVVSCPQGEALWEATLRCSYQPEESTVEVLAPETIAGIRAVLDGETLVLEYENVCLDAGPVSSQNISPADCLPRLMTALREGWLLEENTETWAEESCRRLTVDQSGENGGKILSTVWLREEDGTPVRGEITVDGENILTVEFTDFAFCDKINNTADAGI